MPIVLSDMPGFCDADIYFEVQPSTGSMSYSFSTFNAAWLPLPVLQASAWKSRMFEVFGAAGPCTLQPGCAITHVYIVTCVFYNYD